MKKIFYLSLCVAISGCSMLNAANTGSTTTTGNSSVRAKMQSCMLSEANSRFQAGTLFNNTISATADELVSTCVKKLAVSSLGISEEAHSSAETIISNLKNMAAAQ